MCDLFYLTEAGHPDLEPFLGTLQTFVFRDEDEIAMAEEGPVGLVETYMESGELQQCAVIKVFERLHGRAITIDERKTLLPEVLTAFEDSGWNFKALVKALVTRDTYRRMVR